MKDLKYIIHLLFIFQLLVLGCDGKPKDQNIEDSLDTIKNEIIQVPSSNNNVSDQSTLPPYKGIDSLVRLLDDKFAFSEVKKLDSVCLGSDGDLTEYLGSVTISLLDHHLNDFLKYLQMNSNSCLKVRLIEGLGAKYSVYQKTERSEKLLQEKNRLISIAKEQELGDRKIDFIGELFNKVNPNVLD